MPQRASTLTHTALLQPGLGPMPDELKNGAKQALPEKEKYNNFVRAVKDLKEGRQTRDQVLVTIKTLLGNAPGLFEKFEVWSAPASGAPSVPAAMNSSNAAPAGPKRENVLTELVFKSQSMKGGEASALAHVQAFPHTSRAISHWLQHTKNDIIPPDPPYGRACITQATHAFASSSLATRRRPTPATPELPIRMGGGAMQAINLDEAIRQLDKLLKIDQNREPESHSATSSPPPSARSREGSELSSVTVSSLEEEKEFKPDPPKPAPSFNTKIMLRRAEEKARDGYGNFRLRRPLEQLKECDRTVSETLGMLKQKLGECPSARQAGLIEDQARLVELLGQLRRVEAQLQQVCLLHVIVGTV